MSDDEVQDRPSHVERRTPSWRELAALGASIAAEIARRSSAPPEPEEAADEPRKDPS
jgi:hypothetical protein